MRSYAHDTEENDPPAEGPGVALPMLMALEIFALMTFVSEGLNTSSLLRDLLRVDMGGDREIAWCTSQLGHPFYVRGGSSR